MATRGSQMLSIAMFCAFTAACGPTVGFDADVGSTGGTQSTPSPSTTAGGTTPNPTGPTSEPGTATAATTIDPSDTGSDTGSESSSDDGEDTCVFLCPGEFDGSGGLECDVWSQDCPEEEKCMPWSNDGSNQWNAARCSPLAPAAQELGEPCAVEGSAVSGIDHCGFGMMCLFVDPETLLGTCVANCDGPEADPQCDEPSNVCVIEFDGVLHQCLPACDPLVVGDCDRGSCYPFGHPDVEGFACGVPLLPSIPDFEPCTFDWECNPGSMCSRPEHPAACEFGECCTPICDLGDPEACGPDRTCSSVFPDGEGPPELEGRGYCALP